MSSQLPFAADGFLPEEAAGWRTLGYVSLARVVIASALLLSLAIFGAPLLGRTADQASGAILVLALVYFLSAAAYAFAALYVRRRLMWQVVGQLATDLVLITAMSSLGGGLSGAVPLLYFFPLAAGALMLPSVPAFFVCALAVLALLADAFARQLQTTASSALLFQAGLYGAALFGLTGLLRLLSQRLAEQQRLVQLRSRDLENQLEINRLVIAQMEHGVVVVDTATRVRANNRAARLLLGLPASMQLTGHRLVDFQNLLPLVRAFEHWLEGERGAGAWSNSVVQALARPGDDETPSGRLGPLQLRARFARPLSETSDEFVIFLEDVYALEERAQQLKLAAMGRLTASIAHEIRNPLAAISHAGQLLAEETKEPLLQRLSAIVRENTVRLDRLVQDVLRVARREPPVGEEFELGPFVQAWLDEFKRDRANDDEKIVLSVRPEIVVKFEQSHLRQVLFNLVDNALRYGSGRAGCVEVVVERSVDDDRARVWVFDDGPGVAPDLRNALFEPFFTTHARGTGLGLYIAREFCLANRSDLTYGGRRQLDGSLRMGFELRFARVAGEQAAQFGFLDTAPLR
ncbi:MAG TPA: ATP-binding protein [Burkholderiaceae bacterium]|nr:ATP-binding protein [Burkholderiaceae bacterium]